MNYLEDSELIYAENLYKKRYLLGPIKFKCNNNTLYYSLIRMQKHLNAYSDVSIIAANIDIL